MKGVCNCGNVEFEIDRDNIKLYQCHCSLCRKQSGTYSNAATIVPTNSFRFLKGESLITQWKKPSGFRSEFCSKCGSPVPNSLRGSDYYWIPAGLLEDDTKFEIVSHIFTDSKASWEGSDANAENHRSFPNTGIEGHIRKITQ